MKGESFTKSNSRIVLIMVVLSLLNVGSCENSSYKIVDASEILSAICNGEKMVNYNSVMIKGDLNLSGIIINKSINITESKFEGNLNFNGTKFLNILNIKNTKVMGYGDLRDTQFIGPAIFEDACFFGYISFYGANFNGFASFKRTNFFRHADFMTCNFSQSVTYKDAIFKDTAGFAQANFSDFVEFENATFIDLSTFYKAVFNRVSFYNSHFNKDAIFYDAIFNGDTSFEKAELQSLNLTKSIFDKRLILTNTRFNEIVLDNTIFGHNSRLSLDGSELCKSDSSRIFVDWRSIENKLDYNDIVYLNMINNFKKIGHFSDADGCYYQYKKMNQLKATGIYKIIDIIMWVFCGYGVRIEFTLLWIICSILIFGLVFSIRTSSKNILEHVFFSAQIFFTLHPPIDSDAEGKWKYLVLFEDIFGWFLMAIFIATLTNMVIR